MAIKPMGDSVSYANVNGEIFGAALVASALVSAGNITSKFREAFETYSAGTKWAETADSGDIIQVDGNAAAASYLVISKDPLSAGTVSSVETVSTFEMPFEMAIGLHMSQRTLGQEFSVEAVSTEEPISAPHDVAISAIQQATTTLTVTTAAAHGLKPGMRFGIRGCADSRMNYPALVVASTPSATQFTATAGPGGAIASVTAGPFATGYVYQRSAMGYAPNGTSMILENATATNASFYVRSESGDSLPSGTILGNHAITILTTASVQAINAALAYAFQPTDEFRLAALVDGIQWSDVAVDSVGQTNNRVKRTQVVPDITATYKFRIRATNDASLTRPVAKIVSAAKTGTTTATVVTDAAHGLTTGDWINAYGVRDTTNFANLTTATVVASVVNSTTFTVIWGSAATATGYGGFVARVNGGQTIQGLATMVGQSVSRTSNVVTLVGSAAWSGILIGDYVNLHGCRNSTNGGDVGLDGAYRVRDIQTTSLFLEPIGTTATGANVGSVNCGGAIIRRTDLRISFVRVMDFDRLRVEALARPSGDASSAVPVAVSGGIVTTVSTVSTVSNVAAIAAGTNAIGDVGVQYRASATGAATAVPVMSPATPAGVVSKAAAGRVVGWHFTNSSAALKSVKFFNTASAITMGTTSAFFEVDVPAAASVVLDIPGGIAFSTGIGWATTGGKGLTDNTSVTLNDVTGFFLYA